MRILVNRSFELYECFVPTILKSNPRSDNAKINPEMKIEMGCDYEDKVLWTAFREFLT